MNPKRTLWRFVSIVLTIALLVFAYNYITDLLSRFQQLEVSINWTYVVLSALLFSLSYVLFAFNWLLSTRLLDKSSGRAQIVAFLASLPFKYLPTSFFTFSSRAYFGHKLGLRLKHASLAQIAENMSLLSANLILLIGLCAARFNLALGAAVLLTVIMGALWLTSLKRKVTLSFKRRSLELPVSVLAKMIAISSVGWLVCGMAFATLIYSLGIEVNVLVVLIANTIAFSLGMIVFFAPGGIGVRELVYDIFSIAVPPIVFWRILVFVVDFMIGLPAIILTRHLRPKS